MLERFSNQKIALLGAGKENISLLPILVKVGAQVTICDRAYDQTSEELQKKYPEAEVRTGVGYLDNLGDFDVLFRSPGLPLKVVKIALKGAGKQPELTSVTNLLLEILPGKTIGVTGTKGKGTTSTLIGSILKAAGKPYLVAGNIGETVFDHFSELNNQTITVLELSSFQLEDVTHSPKIAVLLPITQDHLQPLSERSPNYHETLADYIEAKGQLTLNQTEDDSLVYAYDSLATHGLAKRSRAKKIGVSLTAGVADYLLTDQGWLTTHGRHWLNLSETGLKGEHNWLNGALAALVGKELGISDEHIIEGLKTFQPLPHRFEQFISKNGVTVIDDSYATMPDATMAALTAFEEPIIWIGGGSTKGADFTDLAHAMKNSTVKYVLLFGQEASKISASLKQYAPKIPQESLQSLDKVVKRALELAKNGDVILLSPACASKDMFKDAAERGDRFQDYIRQGLGV